MTIRWPVASEAAIVAVMAVTRPADAATNGSVRARLGCGYRSDRPSAAVNDINGYA